MVRYLNYTTHSDINTYFLKNSLWPAIIYTSLLMLVGTVGNILVIIVYRRQFRRSVTRMFIYALAILDLGNCLITMPAELLILIEFTTFPSPAWCKASRYLTYTFNGTSSIILISIALDRYFKVCRPTQLCINVKRASYICIGSFLFTAIVSVPALVLYGEMTLPLLVTSTDVSILTVDNEYNNMSVHHSTVGVTGSFQGVSHRPYESEQYDIRIVTLEGQGRPAVLLSGTFCLLNSDHIDSALPLLFYASMFIMYLVMVILVVFFYSKVARAMFILTSKHSKMFTFYDHKNNSTPATNSVAEPEGEGNIYFSRPGSRVLLDLNYKQERRAVDSFTGSEDRFLDDDRGAKPRAKLKVYTDEFKESLSVPNTGNGETGYDSADANSASDLSLKRSPRVNNTKERKDTGQTCEDLELLPKTAVTETLPVQPTSPRSKSLDDISRPTSPAEQIHSSLLKRSSRKKSEKKIPKIKIDDVGSRASDLNIAHLCVANDNPMFLSSNSLLLRRIKSAENVYSLTRLYKLQVPHGRSRKAKFPDIDSGNASTESTQKRAQRENAAGIGQIHNSNVDLAVVRKSGDATDGQNAEGDTLTLTKNSMKGKTKLCVIPLTGLSSKTAMQVQDSRHGMKTEETSGDVDVDVLGGVDIMKSSHSIDDSSCDGNDGGTAQKGNETKQPGSNVTLRPKTPQSSKTEKQGGKMSADRKTPSTDKVTATPRKEIVSTADILQERHQRASLHPVRTSRMLFIISLVFVISFLPFFVIVLARSSQGSAFITSLTNLELGFISVFIRSSLISNAVNPIVYGLLSTHFRRECTGIMCCIFKH